ncbi:hypothetical protein N1Z41_00032405 [Pseudomonas aeruginosa]
MYFDQAELDRHGQKAVIQEIKKRWSRQQFSERNADKRQVNAMLPHDLINQIDELAQKHGLKQREVIEALLRKGIESRTFPIEPQGNRSSSAPATTEPHPAPKISVGQKVGQNSEALKILQA